MSRIFLLLITSPIFFASLTVVSTEKDFVLTPTIYSSLHQVAYKKEFTSIPKNLNVFSKVDTYRDKELTQLSYSIFPNQRVDVIDFILNNKQEPVFVLKDGSYILADPNILFDDIVYSSQSVNQIYYLKESASFLSSPIRNQAVVNQSPYRAYQPVQVTEISKTAWGIFAYIPTKGWIDMTQLSDEDLRMEAVQKLLDSKYNTDNLAIYVKQLSTNNTAGVNETKLMYSASISKLPLLYYVQQQIDTKKFQLTSQLIYTKEVLEFQGSYNPWGSGSISKESDNLPYSISDLILKTAKESDNVASNMLAYYVANQFDSKYQAFIQKTLGQNWDMVSRMASPKMAGEIIEALYVQNGLAFQALKITDFDNQRIARDIPVEVAHKIGDADEFKHDVAIIYTNQPFVLSIFTKNANYEQISQIANDIYGILQ